MIRFLKGRAVVGSLFAAVLAVTLLEAQAPPAGRSGFRALTGQDAAAFTVPGDMRLVARGPAGNGVGAVARYRQFVGDAEVLGGQLSIYTDATGLGTAVIGAHYPGLRPMAGPRIGPAAAQAVAAARRPDLTGEWRADLMVRPDTASYFYRVEVRDLASRWFFWIDAETGAVTNEYDGLTTGSGAGVNGITKDLRGLTTFGNGTYAMSTARLTTFDARNRQTLPGLLATDADDLWDTPGRTSPGQPAMVDAHFYANVTDVYYQAQHGFNWLERYPQGMRSSVHVGRNYNNAGWNGTQMIYGDGDGRTFIEFSGDLDVVGHELSHGVTEATSNLIYQNESGALNEAFSDIMGTAIEHYHASGNWTIGEDITPGTNGLRNMANPNEDGDPSHYADRYTGTSDNGGVHTNSGIANHWFYLLVNGGENANLNRRDGVRVASIGLAAAEQIVYEGFTALPANANFCAARAATIARAGGHEVNVAAAWDEVGVDEELCSGGSGDVTAPVISNVASQKLKGGKFKITWTTNENATSVVMFPLYGTFSNSALVTNHSMSFTGSNGVAYQYYVTSTDASGNSSTAGPFTHQN
jgi:bacillolysin